MCQCQQNFCKLNKFCQTLASFAFLQFSINLYSSLSKIGRRYVRFENRKDMGAGQCDRLDVTSRMPRYSRLLESCSQRMCLFKSLEKTATIFVTTFKYFRVEPLISSISLKTCHQVWASKNHPPSIQQIQSDFNLSMQRLWLCVFAHNLDMSFWNLKSSLDFIRLVGE